MLNRGAGEILRRSRAPALVVAAGLAATAIALAAYETGALRRAELSTVDTRFEIRGARTPPRDVVVVEIDDASIKALGGWPFPREIHAEAISRLSKDRPSVIAYDVQFSEWHGRRGDDALLAAVAGAHGKVVLATTQGELSGPLKPLSRIAPVGDTGLPNDPGIVLRRMPYSVGELKSFAVAAAETAQGKLIDPSSMDGGLAWIDYEGPPGTIPTVPFSELVAGRNNPLPGFFAGKVVVVGAVAPSLQDLHTTPVSSDEQMSGPEIVASAVSTALAGFPLRSAPGWMNVALVVLLGLLVPLVSLRLTLPIALAIGVGAGALFAVCAQLAFDSGWIVAFVYPVVALVLSSIAVLAVRYALTAMDARTRAAAPAAHVPLGTEVAGYRTERQLGRGGGGTVYLSTDGVLRRKVALKVLNPELAENEEFRKHFLHESQLAAALDHPHVVPVYGAGSENGRMFVAMKWVRGSLAALLSRDGRLESERTVAIVEQVASALDAAHAIGLVHRDVTPSNILLDPPRSPGALDHAYLADFGLTRHHGLTSTVERVGKPDYVAPEQIRGEPIDSRADLYSLGCVLYECLVGEPPFAGDSEIGVIGGHLSHPPPAVTARCPQLPAAIDDVVARALAKHPEQRYESCGDLAAAARAALLGSAPARPRPEEVGGRA